MESRKSVKFLVSAIRTRVELSTKIEYLGVRHFIGREDQEFCF